MVLVLIGVFKVWFPGVLVFLRLSGVVVRGVTLSGVVVRGVTLSF